jgi:hypothetical protein
VLVKNGFANPGAFGDLVHAGGVVAMVDEDVAGHDEQLATALVAGQPIAPPVRVRHAVGRPTTGTPGRCLGDIAHRVLIYSWRLTADPVGVSRARRNDITTRHVFATGIGVAGEKGVVRCTLGRARGARTASCAILGQ